MRRFGQLACPHAFELSGWLTLAILFRALLTTGSGLGARILEHGMSLALRYAMPKLASTIAALTLALAASPAFANGEGAQVPEASAATLFAMGLLGILIGRRGAMKSQDRDED